MTPEERDSDLSTTQKRIGRPLLKQMGQIIQQWLDLPVVQKTYIGEPDDPSVTGFPAMGVFFGKVEECMEAAILAERERCARVAEEYILYIHFTPEGSTKIKGTKIAAAIREDPT